LIWHGSSRWHEFAGVELKAFAEGGRERAAVRYNDQHRVGLGL
jgi:hypothetical protein